MRRVLATLALALLVAGCRTEGERIGLATLPNAEVLQNAQLGAVSFTLRDASVRLYSLHCTNRSASNAWVQLFQASDGQATWPGTGNVPQDQYLLPAGGMIVIGDDYYSLSGSTFLLGLTWGVSSTAGTFTAATPASNFDCSVGYQ